VAHRLLADHLLAEQRFKTVGRGRVVDVWKMRPRGGDNHWLDCLAGAAVAASMCGCEIQAAVGRGKAGVTAPDGQPISLRAAQALQRSKPK
jgi:hypothetical protein